LHAALAVGEGAVLFSETGRWQHHVGDFGRFVQEDVLHHQEREPLDRFAGMVQVRLGQQRVLADDVHGPDLTGQRALDDLGGAQPLFGRDGRSPGRNELL